MVDLLDDDTLLDLRKRRAPSDVAGTVADMRRGDRPMPESNQALREWRPGAKRHDGCHLCGRRPRLQCQACQRPACGADSWVMLGLCRTCATEERVKLRRQDERTVSDDWLDGD